MNDYILKQTLKAERGTWREALRTKYGTWLDLDYGFRVLDGWQGIIGDMLDEIAEIVGGTEACPDVHIFEVKEKFGGLRVYLAGVPEEHKVAVGRAVDRAEERSFTVCEVCGQPGQLVQSGGYWHVACRTHEDPRSWRGE